MIKKREESKERVFIPQKSDEIVNSFTKRRQDRAEDRSKLLRRLTMKSRRKEIIKADHSPKLCHQTWM